MTNEQFVSSALGYGAALAVISIGVLAFGGDWGRVWPSFLGMFTGLGIVFFLSRWLYGKPPS